MATLVLYPENMPVKGDPVIEYRIPVQVTSIREHWHSPEKEPMLMVTSLLTGGLAGRVVLDDDELFWLRSELFTIGKECKDDTVLPT